VTNVSSGNVSTGSSAPPKRKRSVNPQGEENFLRALDAVRFGGIGFCKLSIFRIFPSSSSCLYKDSSKLVLLHVICLLRFYIFSSCALN
jgi:hypothetical protein